MKKINFDIKIIGLDGRELEGFSVKETIANIIIGSQSKSPVRSLEIARKIYADGEVELLAEDLLIVKTALEGKHNLTDLALGQILPLLD